MRTLSFIVASCTMASVAYADTVPFRFATKLEAASLTQSSVIATPLNQTTFKTGAYVTVKKPSAGETTKAQRGNQAASAVYKSAISAGIDPNPHPVPPNVQPSDVINYEVNGNSVQAWATMSELGVPYVRVYADGQTQGSATASWSTRYAVQGSGSREVFVQFKVPAVNLYRRFSDSSPTLYWGRLRVDFLVNAYPAWYTESNLFNDTYFDDYNYEHEKTKYVENFGSDIGLSADSYNTSSEERTITLKLGTYPAGKTFDFTLLFRVEGKVAESCVTLGEEFACSNVDLIVQWDPNAPQPTFYSKPVT